MICDEFDLGFDFINESIFPSVTMYHGSANKYDTLKPVVYSGGHLLRKHSWSIFLFHQHKLACQWAIFSALDKIAEKIHLDYPVYRYERIGFDDYTTKIGVRLNDLEKFIKYIKNNNTKCYVYTVEINNMSKLGLGNTDCQPEYTYDEEIKPSKTDVIKVTETTIKGIVFGLDDANYYDWLHNRPNMRGILSILYNNKKAMKEYGHVWDEVKKGNLKPGEDLDDIIFESFELDDYLDIALESSNKTKKKRKKITPADIAKAKHEAYLKILQSAQYRAAVTRMSASQRQEVQYQIRNRINDNVEDSRDFLEKNPYLTATALVVVALVGGTYLAYNLGGAAIDFAIDGAEFIQKSVEAFFDNNIDLFSDGASAAATMVDLDILDAVDLTDAAMLL